MERNFANEIEEIGREELKSMIVSAYQLQGLNPWHSRYAEKLKLETLEDAGDFVRCLIDFMIDEKFMVDMVQDVVDMYHG